MGGLTIYYIAHLKPLLISSKPGMFTGLLALLLSLSRSPDRRC